MLRATVPIALAVCFTLMLAAMAQAQSRDGNVLVKLSLLTETTAMEAGRPLRVGVLLNVEPGYHIYWINPGESGQPPEVKWKLPEGFVAGDLQWPAPRRFVVPGGIVNFGYEGEVLLVATITPTATAAVGRVELAAECSWLVCNDDVCLPGRGTATLKFGDAAQAAADRKRIEAAIASVPVPAEKSANVARVNASDAAETRGVKIEWSGPVSQAEFFPLSYDGLKIVSTSVSTNKRSNPPVTAIEIVAAPVTGSDRTATTVRGVLAYNDAEGRRLGIELSVPAKRVSP